MTAMSYDAAAAHVIETNPAFAIGRQTIRGTEFSVFTNAPNSLRDLVQASREIQGNGQADYLFYQDECWTYDAYCDDICALARALELRGIGKGDRVALAMRNSPEMLILFMAIVSTGAVVVFLNAWWTVEELDYALGDSKPTTVFADGKRMERLLELRDRHDMTLIGIRDGEAMAEPYSALRETGLGAGWPTVDIHPEDDFGIMYSSGTTGHPKGVVLTHRGAVNAVYTWLFHAMMQPLMQEAEPDPNPPRPGILVVTPLFHVTATHPVFLCSMPIGSKIILMYKWDAEEAVNLIRDHEVTRFIGVPTQSADLLDASRRMGLTLDTLTFLASGGAKRPSAQVGELAEAFPNVMVATGWGMTETNAIGIGMFGPEYVARPGGAGRLYPPVQELRFLDPEGRDVPKGEVGEITVKSPCNMRCYLNKPEATAQVMQDGWLRTGDLGQIDDDGYITIVDRAKNIIIRGGENIACLDVESALHHHPAVNEACCFPVPHARLGETVGAAIQLKPGAKVTEEALRSFLADHISHFKIPEHIWMQTDPLPRGATDKLDRRGIRDHCNATLTTGKPDHANAV